MAKATDVAAQRGWWGLWTSLPLYWRILLGMLLGIAAGMLLGQEAQWLRIPSGIILQLLSALAPPLILIAVIHVLMTSDIPRSSVARLAGLLLLNTCVAILIGLTVANLMQPGKWSAPRGAAASGAAVATLAEGEGEGGGVQAGAPEGSGPEEVSGKTGVNPFEQLLGSLPHSLLGPLGDKQNVIGVIIIAIAFGVALRDSKNAPLNNLTDLVEIAYRTLIVVLHWVIELVPVGVACIVAAVIGTEGFGAFVNLGAFVIAVLIALSLQAVWYLVRIRLFCWARPLAVLKGMRDALLMAFSTDSSTATMPVTYACLKEKVGVREKSASLGALVGANFNNDGTALYEAMAALFVAQMVGMDLTLIQQLTIVFTSIIASVGAAGIPEAGIVTMTLVFTAVGLDVSHIPILLTVDWFLDRCRTTINVMGDVNVACLLDGYEREASPAAP